MNTIKCPNCKQEIEVSEALSHQVEEQVRIDVEKSARVKFMEEMELTLKDKTNEFEELKAKLKKQQEEMLDLSKSKRELKDQMESIEIENQKKLDLELERIKIDVLKKSEDEHRLKDLEKDKKISDALKQVEEMKTKMQQGSMQTQGEVFELELQNILQREFPTDIISEVAKGVRGGDITQTVIDKSGQRCGVILWESKNAQWSDKWLAKLRDDQREAKAEIAVLVSVNLPKEYKTYQEGVWIISREAILASATFLRFNLVQANFLKRSQEGKKEKADAIYSYVSSHEFSLRVQSMLEHYSNLQKEMEQERRWFALKWARQEKSLRVMIDQTNGFYGDLQGVMGNALPEIKSFSLPEGQEE